MFSKAYMKGKKKKNRSHKTYLESAPLEARMQQNIIFINQREVILARTYTQTKYQSHVKENIDNYRKCGFNKFAFYVNFPFLGSN